jgi:hypothetical protein
MVKINQKSGVETIQEINKDKKCLLLNLPLKKG